MKYYCLKINKDFKVRILIHKFSIGAKRFELLQGVPPADFKSAASTDSAMLPKKESKCL